MTLISFAAAWIDDGIRERAVFEVTDAHPVSLRAFPAAASADLVLDATLFPALTDHHVHLGLVDPAELFENGITQAVDLGWIPEIAQTWAMLEAPRVRIAGALLTCVGGYPSSAGWASRGSAVEVREAGDADAAVAAQHALGASVIKVTLNSDVGPVPDDALLDAFVVAAHRRGLPVHAHAQGVGQAERALSLRVDVLAHAPFSEKLSDAALTAMVASGMSWVSTLDIHGWGHPTREFPVAVDNVRRFAAAGGEVLYGTDAGNGPLPVGVDARELAALVEAGLGSDALLATIATSAWEGGAEDLPAHIAIVPGSPPERIDELPEWLESARGCSVEDLLTRGTV